MTSIEIESAPRGPAPLALTDLGLDELVSRLEELGSRPFHAKQILTWVYGRRATGWESMTDLSKALRGTLALTLPFSTGSQVLEAEIAPDTTEKLRIGLADRSTVEGVIIRENARITFCVSTQVGCAAGCGFCRSGLHGLKRNLSRGEIVEEVLHLSRRLRADERVSNLVFMGIGEPLDNYTALVGALTTLRAPWGFELSPRRITVSTVGRLNRIRQLADEGFAVTLAVSLHAGRQETRDRLIRGGPRVAIADLVAEARRYAETTGRDVTFEYVLVKGENDSVEEAEALGKLVAGGHTHVNLIPVNPVAETGFLSPDLDTLHRFRDALVARHVPVTVRKRKGDEIMAACGQLSSQLKGR